MNVPQACLLPQREVSRPLDLPLPELLAAHDIELVESSITDPGFLGALVVRRDGQRVLAMPAGRSARERDAAAHLILAEALEPARA